MHLFLCALWATNRGLQQATFEEQRPVWDLETVQTRTISQNSETVERARALKIFRGSSQLSSQHQPLYKGSIYFLIKSKIFLSFYSCAILNTKAL